MSWPAVIDVATACRAREIIDEPTTISELPAVSSTAVSQVSQRPGETLPMTIASIHPPAPWNEIFRHHNTSGRAAPQPPRLVAVRRPGPDRPQARPRGD